MFGIRKKVAKTARRAGLVSGGLILCTVGTAFLTVAGWLALEPVIGATVTATVIAGLYLGIGLILVGVGVSSEEAEKDVTHPDMHRDHPPRPTDGPPVVQAFMYGLQAGAQADRSRH